MVEDCFRIRTHSLVAVLQSQGWFQEPLPGPHLNGSYRGSHSGPCFADHARVTQVDSLEEQLALSWTH